MYCIAIKYFYCHTFHTWASGSNDRANPIPRIDTKKLIDWLFTAKISSKCPQKNQKYCRFRKFLSSKTLLYYDVTMTRNIQLTRKDFTTIPQLTDTFFELIHQWGLLLDCSRALEYAKIRTVLQSNLLSFNCVQLSSFWLIFRENNIFHLKINDELL